MTGNDSYYGGGMEVGQIRAFVEVARSGSVKDASLKLRYNQSGVSRQVQSLERHLGLHLFSRSGNRLSLTPPGYELLPLAEALVAVSDALIETAVRAGKR